MLHMVLHRVVLVVVCVLRKAIYQNLLPKLGRRRDHRSANRKVGRRGAPLCVRGGEHSGRGGERGGGRALAPLRWLDIILRVSAALVGL